MPRSDVLLQLLPRRLPTERALGRCPRAAGARWARLRLGRLHVPPEFGAARGGGAGRAAGLAAAQGRALQVPPGRRLGGQRLPAHVAQHHGSGSAGSVRASRPALLTPRPPRARPAGKCRSPGRGGRVPRGGCWERRAPPLPGQCGARRGGVRHLTSVCAAGAERSGAAISRLDGGGRRACPPRWVRREKR